MVGGCRDLAPADRRGNDHRRGDGVLLIRRRILALQALLGLGDASLRRWPRE